MECDDGGGGGDVRLFPPLSSSSSSAGGAGAEMGNFREVAPSIHPGHFFFKSTISTIYLLALLYVPTDNKGTTSSCNYYDDPAY